VSNIVIYEIYTSVSYFDIKIETKEKTKRFEFLQQEGVQFSFSRRIFILLNLCFEKQINPVLKFVKKT
jgi:hypothetical protein